MKSKEYLILASASPRRRELLAAAGYEFDVVPSGIDESAFSSVNVAPVEYAKRLALAKAKDVAAGYPSALVIGADTIADSDGRIIGKPSDAADAEAIARRLFARPHKVITGVAIVCLDKKTEIVEADTTIVHPRKLSERQLRKHIKSGIWQDKAGAYAIREKDDPFVGHIEGSLSNVMGLPMELLARLLGTLGRPNGSDFEKHKGRIQ